MSHSNYVPAAISYGELIDKLTILLIKVKRITDETKLLNVKKELEILSDIFDKHIGLHPAILTLMKKLKVINEKLWVIEDDIRAKERLKEFDQEFIDLARSVYFTNDERCAIKRKIDITLGSTIREEKSYETY
jgi:hypothetical protein